MAIAMQSFASRFDQPDFGKFKAKKIAYLTDAINLTPAEAEKFWPVYNEFDQKMFDLIKGKRELEKKLEEKIEDLSEEQYVELAKKIATFHKNEGHLFMEYNEKFLKILPPRKVVELYVAEMNFKGFLLREYKRGDPGHDHKPNKTDNKE